ncbi:MAG TPA: ribosome-associated translation inhibitor RaiA [Nitrospiraceae bacterium]|jgi:putative sigma-54 modulation protein|nr:ribosome-associated translation inhibitor RaiA [Nitrospiraceae bacterium]
MALMITGRHVEVTPALRRYVESRFKRLAKYGTRFGDVQVVLSVEKYRHVAEVVLPVNGAVVQGKTSTTEMYASIDQLFDKVSRQILKRKEKLTNHKIKPATAVARARTRRASPPAVEVETVRVMLHDLSMAQAAGRLGDEPHAFVVFKDPVMNRVQVLRRLESGIVQLIDPRPSS